MRLPLPNFLSQDLESVENRISWCSSFQQQHKPSNQIREHDEQIHRAKYYFKKELG